MKTFITLIIGAGLALGIERGIEWCQDPPPPSPEAQVIIDSMNNVEGWRLGKKDNCIVNEKANTTICAGGFPGYLAAVQVWDTEKESKNRELTNRQFGLLDRWHIGQHYDAVRRKLEVGKF